MAPANSLDELRRRIGHGTTPVAFAALAEEHRRAGRLDEAVAVCREGLERYPTYASARVTLGRALLDLEEVQEAFVELEEAVAQAPDNLAAARALELARTRLGDATDSAIGHRPMDSTTNAPVTMADWLTDGAPVPEAAAPTDAAPPGPTVDDPAADQRIPLEALAWLVPGADESVDDVTDVSFASEVPAADGEHAPFDWTVTAAPRAESPPDSWSASVEDAVADVFAAAPGGAHEPAAPDVHAPAEGSLDALQTLLEAIRARRALLSGTHSGVD